LKIAQLDLKYNNSTIFIKKKGETMSKTQENLKTAFAGESQANRRYLAFSKKAEKDGYPQIAKLFRAVAEAETIHAHAHLRMMKGIGSTADNLKEAISGETHEFSEMYPKMIEEAAAEGEKAAERIFNYANEVEKIHANLYQNALNNMDNIPEQDYYVCSVCGYTCENKPPETCPVCNAKAKVFFKVD
jgi:rubrerythrin